MRQESVQLNASLDHIAGLCETKQLTITTTKSQKGEFIVLCLLDWVFFNTYIYLFIFLFYVHAYTQHSMHLAIRGHAVDISFLFGSREFTGLNGHVVIPDSEAFFFKYKVLPL